MNVESRQDPEFNFLFMYRFFSLLNKNSLHRIRVQMIRVTGTVIGTPSPKNVYR